MGQIIMKNMDKKGCIGGTSRAKPRQYTAGMEFLSYCTIAACFTLCQRR